MTILEFQDSLDQIAEGTTKLCESSDVAINQETSNVPSTEKAELIETFRSLNEQLLSLAPHMAAGVLLQGLHG